MRAGRPVSAADVADLGWARGQKLASAARRAEKALKEAMRAIDEDAAVRPQESPGARWSRDEG